MKTIKEHLGLKLLISYLVVLLVGAVVLFFTVMFATPGAYTRHMEMTGGGMMIDGSRPSDQLGLGRGQGAGFLNFRAGVFESLGYAVFAAVLVAITVSVFFSRTIIAPLRAMMSASHRIADGRYDERVSVNGSDELAQLAERFNRMAERLDQTESMRRQLIGDVSHELRTPLTAIGGYMEGLIDGVLPATDETYDQVRMEARRLSRLVDDLQELSRVESGSYRLDIHPVQISTLVATIVRRLAPQYADKQVKLQIDIPGNLPEVLADEDRITQVITNLLANALTYTQLGGEVTISSAAPVGHDLLVTVADTGIGITPDNAAHIFDRFYRVDKSRSRSHGGGSGIGLTIAKAIVEAHHGRIWVESAGEDQGSRFSFSLPIKR